MNSDFGAPNLNGGFGILSEDEVLFVRAGRVLMSNPTFKTGEFLDALAQLISENEEEWSEDQEGWFSERGTRCEVLRFGNQGWQRGRVRIRLEFCPDNPPKLLRESRSPREQNREEPYQDTYQDLYQPDDPYRPEKSRRRSNRDDRNREPSYRENVYREDIYSRDQRTNDLPLYPEPLYPEIDQDY